MKYLAILLVALAIMLPSEVIAGIVSINASERAIDFAL